MITDPQNKRTAAVEEPCPFPTNPAAEKALLGTCIFEPSFVDQVLEQNNGSSSELFWDLKNKELWNRIERLRKAGKPLTSELIMQDRIEQPIDFAFLCDIQNAYAVEIEWSLRDCQESRLRRKATFIADDLRRGSSNKPIREILTETETALSALYKSNDTHEINDAIQNVVERWEWAYEHQGQLSGISSGLDALDRLTWGFQKRNLIVIGARPSQGKTALLIKIATAAAMEAKLGTLFFSLESSTEEIVRRIVCQRRHLDASALRAGNFTKEDLYSVNKEFVVIKKAPLWIVDEKGLTVSQMKSIAKGYAKRSGLKLIVIDYLQKVRSAERKEKRTYEVGEVSSGLKDLADTLDVPVVAAAQLNRESDKEKGRMPRISDLADSSQIERDADVIALLAREKEQKSRIFLSYRLLLSKQRDGPTGIVPLTFIPKTTEFVNAERHEDEPEEPQERTPHND